SRCPGAIRARADRASTRESRSVPSLRDRPAARLRGAASPRRALDAQPPHQPATDTLVEATPAWARTLHRDQLGTHTPPHAVHHPAPEGPLSEDRVLGCIEREEDDPTGHAEEHHQEQLCLLDGVAVLPGERPRVPPDEVAIREDLLLPGVRARATLVEDR